MNREDYQKVKKIFQSAIEIAPDDRSAFLDKTCADNNSLRRNVEILLHSFQSEFLEESAISEIAEQIVNSQISIGQTIGRYKIQELIGVGGMGEVFLAEDSLLHRKVAIKVLLARLANDNDRVSRFMREARSASALNHPNILTIYEIGEENGLRFIVSEFVRGETLRDKLKRGKFALPEALEIIIQIASALQDAHAGGVIHRDIKPENIMLRDADGLVKVLDFGLAKLTENKSEESESKAFPRLLTQTVPGIIMGTTAYMSPEQARGLAVDERTDIWSLGVVFYEMLTGKLPFEGETTGDLIASILKTEAGAIESFDKEFPAEVWSVISKALTKNLDFRYQTDKELLHDLEGLKKSFETAVDKSKVTDELHEPKQTRNEDRIIPETHGNQKSKIEEPRPTAGRKFLSKTRGQKTGFTILALASLIILGIGFSLYWLASNERGFEKIAGLFRPRSEFTLSSMKLTKLTDSGSAFGAAISPDGKYAAYQTINGGKYNLWLMELVTRSSVQITPSAETAYTGLTFSPADDYIYYSAADAQSNSTSSVYRMPRLGGEAKKILAQTDSPVGFSGDGKRLAFIRNVQQQGETALIIADADGANERTLAVRKAPDVFSTGKRPAFSPDGKTIACIGINSGENFLRVFAVNVADSAVRPLTSEKWSALQDVVFLPDSDNLLVTAQDDRNFGPTQIWKTSLSGNGAAEKITFEMISYTGLSLAANSRSLITTQTDAFNNIWMIPNGDSKQARQIVSNKGGGRVDMSWTWDRRIVYTSNASGNSNIFVMNADGSNQIQLTSDAYIKRSPAVSPDNRYIIFVSNQAGTEQIWRMDIDGQNQKQLTSVHTFRYPQFSPDGKWIIYTTWQDKKAFVWKISIDGGEPVLLKDGTSFVPNVSPDMNYIAYLDKPLQSGQTKIKIIYFESGELINEFDVPQNTQPDSLRWKSDSSAVIYRCNRNNVFNIWQQRINESEPEQLTDFQFDPAVHCEFSRDGKNLSCVRSALIRDVILFNSLNQEN